MLTLDIRAFLILFLTARGVGYCTGVLHVAQKEAGFNDLLYVKYYFSSTIHFQQLSDENSYGVQGFMII